MIFSVDGTPWDVGCTVNRAAELKASDISGLMLDKSYFNDVIGTYMQYEIRLAVPFGQIDRYAYLYEILTDPVDGHSFVFPYGTGTVQVTGRVSNVSDVYVRMPNGKQHWRGIQFTVTANHPTKKKELGEVISMGMAPLPSEFTADVGSTYQYSDDGWIEVNDADEKYY